MGLIKLYRSGFTKGLNPYQETKAETGMDFDILVMEDGETFEISDKDKEIGSELTQLENGKIELVRKLYKIDETYNIEELQESKNQIISEKKLKKSKIDFGWEKNYQTFTYKLYV